MPDLEVLDGAVVEMTADLGDLEPVEAAQGRAGALDAVADGVVETLLGGADDLGDAVCVVAHEAPDASPVASRSACGARELHRGPDIWRIMRGDPDFERPPGPPGAS